MTDQTDVREFLHRMANEASFAPVEPGPVVRKARRRLARTVGGTLLTAGALVAGALVAANGLMNADRTQMPQPAGQPTPTTTENGEALGEFTERFDSPLNGISIRYPSGWRTRAATEPWTSGELNYDSPAADVIFDPALGDRLYLVLASQPLGGVSEDAWRDEVLAWLCTGNGMAFGSHTVDGADAFVITCGSTASAALIFTDTRAYLIRLVVSSDEPELAETYDWDWHKAMLESVDLRPEDALDALNPSESP